MKLSKNKITAVISVTGLALVGLVAIQIYLLANSLKLRRQAFDQNVNTAMAAIVQKLETQEAVSEVLRLFVEVEESDDPQRSTLSFATVDSTEDFEFIGEPMAPKIDLKEGKVFYFLHQPQHVRIRILDSLGQVVENVVDGYKEAGQHKVAVDRKKISAGQFNFNFTTDSSSYMLMFSGGPGSEKIRDISTKERKRLLVSKVVREWTQPSAKALDERINLAKLDSLVKQTLAEKNIEAAFAYGIVMGAKNDSVVMTNDSQLSDKLLKSQFKSRLFPNDIVADENHLAFYFPRQNLYLFKQISVSVLVSFLFITIIIACFVLTVRAIYQQRDFSSRLTNFINNMTHEFKTPISTISLASEALSQPEILEDRDRILRYGSVIQDENRRMRDQVDKILQMSVLEEGDFELNKTSVDVHELISTAIQKMALRIENRKGKLIASLEAPAHVVEADAVHLANIIHNLLDNAIKYTKSRPTITVSTNNINGSLQICVRDNGIGLKPDERKQVFDKYYRVPTGNVHDVKGFGLGLSYVKLMVEAHGGSVGLQSEPNQGTTFELVLPLADHRSNTTESTIA